MVGSGNRAIGASPAKLRKQQVMPQAPTAAELLQEPIVKQALEQAWRDSLSGDPVQRHEEGGSIYADMQTGTIEIRIAASGAQTTLDLSNPPIIPGSVVVATFHTHPNPSSEGWETGPSIDDTHSAELIGVPCIIRADDGIHTTGPSTRRGGLTGGGGYPR
jgi:hypothetical protein